MSTKIKFDYQSVINAIPSAVIVIDRNKTVVGVNNFARRLYRNTDLLGKSCSEVFSSCARRGTTCPIDNMDFVIPTGMMKVRQKIRIREYEEDVRCRIIPAEIENGEKGHVFLHIILDRDLMAREKLVELEKNLTITTLTAGIAHEFNNMNAGIYGLVELVLSQSNLSRETAQDMSTILKIIRRASHLIDQLLIFANKKPSKRVLVNLENIVDGCVKILRPEFSAQGISIEIMRKSTLDEMFLDANKISLAIMNIMINARDAMIDSDEKKISIETGRDDGQGFVRIQDRGAGIPHEMQDRIFDPFYTTKGSLGSSSIPGTGLGLSVAAGVIKEHNGTIEVESENGKGSTFLIKIPINTMEALDREVAQNYTEFDFSGKKILVVDDEVELNNLLVRALSSKNADARSEYSGARAIDYVEKDPVDLMLLDIQMPDLNGWDVVRHFKTKKNRPRIIIISGNFLVMDASETRFVEKVLIKPFDLQELFQAVNEVLVTG